MSENVQEKTSKEANYQSYTVLDLGGLGGSFSRAFGINDYGQVVGLSETSQGKRHIFIYDETGLQDLGDIDDKFRGPYPIDINNLGHVVGTYHWKGEPRIIYHSFLLDNDQIHDPGTLGGAFSYGFGINNSGCIVGESYTDYGPSLGYFFDGIKLISIGTLGGRNSQARDINDSGLIVGMAQTGKGPYHAFIYDGNKMKDLGTLGGTSSQALAVNDVGQVVGRSHTSIDDIHAFFYSGTGLVDLGSLGGNYSSANDINDAGQVVGESRYSTSSDTHAFISDASSMIDLNALISIDIGVTLTEATGINNRGQIVVTGIVNEQTKAFLLTPEIIE